MAVHIPSVLTFSGKYTDKGRGFLDWKVKNDPAVKQAGTYTRNKVRPKLSNETKSKLRKQ